MRYETRDVKTVDGRQQVTFRKVRRAPLRYRVADALWNAVDRTHERLDGFAAEHEALCGALAIAVIMLIFGFVGGVENGSIWP